EAYGNRATERGRVRPGKDDGSHTRSASARSILSVGIFIERVAAIAYRDGGRYGVHRHGHENRVASKSGRGLRERDARRVAAYCTDRCRGNGGNNGYAQGTRRCRGVP